MERCQTIIIIVSGKLPVLQPRRVAFQSETPVVWLTPQSHKGQSHRSCYSSLLPAFYHFLPGNWCKCVRYGVILPCVWCQHMAAASVYTVVV